MIYLVTIKALDTVEVEADSPDEARELVNTQGADEFASVYYESEVTDVAIP